jgi:uncharacterized protein YndB with AHSA1/START domain
VPAPVEITLSITIGRSTAAVWPYLVDWERLDRWMEEISDVRVSTLHREGIGVEAEATVRIAGISTRDRIRVTRWERPHVLEIAHLGWVRGRGLMELFPQAERSSRLRWTETLIPPWGAVGSLGMRASLPVMRRVFRRDLVRLRDLVESEG